MKSRIILIFSGIVVAWSLLILRAAQIQILPDSRLNELKSRQYQTVINLPARRGVITDRRGRELAVSMPAFSVYADPKEIDAPKWFAREMAKRLGMSAGLIREKIRDRDRRFVWLKRKVSKETAETLRNMKIRGLGVIEEAERVYPNEKFLSHVLGYVDIDGKGIEGLELKYDQKLRGENRKVILERDARGRPLLVDGRIITDTPAGADIELTIDSDLQFMLENELGAAFLESEAESAVGVILDAQTSEVLAMANVPLFDPNRPRDYGGDVRRNRVMTDAFEPGSTIKTLVVAGAIRDGLVKPKSKFFCENGKFKVGDKFIREADAHHSFGSLTVTEILAHSSNIGTAKIAMKMGAKNVRQALEDFGIGTKLGIDLPGEAQGTLHKLPWRDHLLANVSFGHGMTASPIQIASAYAAIANGGILRKPYIVKSVINSENGERAEYMPEDVRRVMSAEDAATMRLMLTAATSETGTGAQAKVPGFPVAGKTGTAQKIEVGKGYQSGKYISSFAGFIPAQNPRFVIYVALDDPKNKYYGAEVAAPLFSRVAGYAVRKSGLKPVLITKKDVMKERALDKRNNEDSIRNIREMTKVLLSDEQNLTPDFTGLTLREVMARMRGTQMNVDIHGRGLVMLTIPSPGEPLPESRLIKVYFKDE